MSHGQGNGDREVLRIETERETIEAPNVLLFDNESSSSSTEEQLASATATTTSTTASLLQQRKHWMAVALGQCIAFIAASMNVTSFLLVQNHGVKTQLFQLFFIYIFLVLHLFFRRQQDSTTWMTTSIHENIPYAMSQIEDRDVDNDVVNQNSNSSIHTSDDIPNHNESNTRMDEPDETIIPSHTFPFFPSLRLRIPWYMYFGMSIVDVIPNFMSLYSYRYTSLTSTTLLSSLTVPSTMLFSRCILRKQFSGHHYIGVLLCVLGGMLTVYVDAFGDSTRTTSANDSIANNSTAFANTVVEPPGQPQKSYIGDVLAICSAVMYGLGDCIAEYSVKHIDRCEYLGMLGFFGILITGAAFPLLEYDAIRDLFHIIASGQEGVKVVVLFLCFIASVCFYYVTEAYFLVTSDATLLNLSMQSVSLWVFLFSVAAYQGNRQPPSTFFLALLFVGSGVFIYEMGLVMAVRRRLPCHQRSRSSSQVEIVPEEREPVVNYQTLVRPD